MIIGVLGGGQLAKMLAQAGQSLGLEFIFLCPNPDACAAPLGEHLCAVFDDMAALTHLAKRADVITFEFESVPLETVEWLAKRVTVCPSPAALAIAQDRFHEKQYFTAMEIPTPDYLAVATLQELRLAVEQIGLPVVLKTRTEGYDGKGQVVLRSQKELESAWQKLGKVSAIVEAMVPFDREISIIAARNRGGDIVYYPLSENLHRDGILRMSRSCERDAMQEKAQDYIGRLLTELDYVGVMALELFDVQGRLLANEIAPRVHNSGHWTIEGAATSQFENHLRAILGQPLGSTFVANPAVVLNLIGNLPADEDLQAIPDIFVHLYGKQPRLGRKLGHITLLRKPEYGNEFDANLARLQKLVDGSANEVVPNSVIQ